MCPQGAPVAEWFPWALLAAWLIFVVGIYAYRQGYNQGVGETRAFYEGKDK